MRRVPVLTLDLANFAPFGRVLEVGTGEVRHINGGTCERHHALCAVDCAPGREPILSIFRGKARTLPMPIAMMERHPLGSQAFMPLQGRDWIAVVAPDEGGAPGKPVAFLANGDQGVSYAANVWHHPLIALDERSDFLVADSRGEDPNLEEADYAEPWTLDLGGTR